MSNPASAPIRVFLSYSWDSDIHKQRVLELAQRLRRDGIEAQIDRFTTFPAEGWSQWMLDQIKGAQFVLVVGTEKYVERFEKKSAPVTGLGATWEGAIITRAQYMTGTLNEKFIPVLFTGGTTKYIPDVLQDFTRFCSVDADAGYDALYRYLTSQPALVAAPLGTRRSLESSTGVDVPAAAAIASDATVKAAPLPELPVHTFKFIANKLPRLQHFYGREKELSAIKEVLDSGSRTWGVLIDGPGGMGKTSLALRAAYDCPPDQFERIIFISVKRRELDDDGDRTLDGAILPEFFEILSGLAHELGRPEIIKSPEKNRVWLILDALCSAKTLLILDNLETVLKADRDKLFGLIKYLPQGCKAILTSRRHIGSSSDTLMLGRLDEAPALRFLADLALQNPLLARSTAAERLRLYQVTNGIPLLLRWTSGQLGLGDCRTIEHALAFLRSCPPENDPLEFIFGDLANDFTSDEIKILLALTQCTEPLLAERIGELAEVAVELAEKALRSLANRSLVVPDLEERAFTLMTMFGDFLRRKWPEMITKTRSRLVRNAYLKP